MNNRQQFLKDHHTRLKAIDEWERVQLAKLDEEYRRHDQRIRIGVLIGLIACVALGLALLFI